MTVGAAPPFFYPVFDETLAGNGEFQITQPWHDWFIKLGTGTTTTSTDITALTAAVGALSGQVVTLSNDLALTEADILALEASLTLANAAISDLQEETTATYANIAQVQEDLETLELLLAAGISGTYVLAKITGGGANGSLTFTGGILTAAVAPT